MHYLYNITELQHIRYLKICPPRKIWWDFTRYIFDYDDFFYQIECVSKKADTQNKSGEAIIGQFDKLFKPFVPTQHTKLVCENKAIEQLYVVRSFLYFTTYREYSIIERVYNQTKQRIKTLATGKQDPIGDLLSKTIGGCQMISYHPKSEEAKAISLDYSNLIDVGLLIQIEQKCLKAFVEKNSYGFHVWNDKFFFELDELIDTARQYDFLKV